MDDKQAALRAADEAFRELSEAVAGLEEPQMTKRWLGSWGVREILIHASGWQREMLPALLRIGRGEPPYPPGVSYDDADGWNAQFVDARPTVTATQAWQELAASHRDFVSVAAELPAGHWAKGAPARELFDGCVPGHYREHAAQIIEWRRSNRS
jgi:hypothetical protein